MKRASSYGVVLLQCEGGQGKQQVMFLDMLDFFLVMKTTVPFWYVTQQ
jgi:hypothetical protein